MSASSALPQAEPRRVLYIDDDPGLGRLVQRHLRREGFEVVLADSGPAGVQAAAAGGFQAIALDHHMPGQDGLATLHALKAVTHCPPIVYATGTEDQRIAVAALKAGAADYVIKDTGGEFFTLLARAIEAAIGQAAMQRRIAAAQDELRRLNETLEQRVVERTAALEEANRQLRDEMTERLRIEAQLVQAQKMEAVGQLTGGAAHDFNNLLTAVLGNLALAESRTGDGEVLRLIRAAIRSAQRGARLTQQLLALARRQELLVRPLDLNALIVEAEDLLARTIDPSVQIQYAPQSGLWPAAADPTQLEVALLNLAINARDAMPHGGRLRIATHNVAAGSLGRPSDLDPPDGATTGDCVALSVADDGVGMPEDVRARAFEPFFTTKEIGRGSGLGLSMVYGLAKQLGGTATIDSTPGLGTTVTIYLPRSSSPLPAQAAQVSVDETTGAQGRVLLVDDDEDVRMIVAEGLRDLGLTVIEAPGGHAALAHLRAERFDALVTDLAMPQMRGSQLAAEVRHAWPDLPVIVVTGYGEEETLDPAVTIVRKPFKASELAACISERLQA